MAFLIQGSLNIPIIKYTLLPVGYKYTPFSQKRQMTFQSSHNNKLPVVQQYTGLALTATFSHTRYNSHYTETYNL